jgi:outer membrane protein assembly factor BamB
MTPSRLGLVAAGLLVVALLVDGAPAPPPPQLPANDPGQFRNGPTRSGYFPGAKLPKKPKVIWTYETEKHPHDPVVTDGVVYFRDDNGNVHAVRADTGKPIWIDREADRDECAFAAAVAVAGKQVFVTSQYGIEAIDRAGGQIGWRFRIEDGAYWNTPLVMEQRLYVGGNDGAAYCLESDSGKLIWKQDIIATDSRPARNPTGEKSLPQSAASDGKRLFLPIFDQRRLLVLDILTGRRLWSYDRSNMLGEPTIAAELSSSPG